MRPIDFEGAALADSPIAGPWGTAGYLPPEWQSLAVAAAGQDCYALGIVIRQLFGGGAPTPGTRTENAIDPPAGVAHLIDRLTDPNPGKRMLANEAAAALSQLL
jgi:hypothetical protein